jgi:predicted kinase
MEWHCNNLIIVSGASGSGKSFFLKNLQKDNDSEFITSIFEEINAPRHNSFRIESIKKFLTSRRKKCNKIQKILQNNIYSLRYNRNKARAKARSLA